MVGYAPLDPKPKPPTHQTPSPRRVFWLLPHDHDTQPDDLGATGAPAEAVDPSTLVAGPRVAGRSVRARIPT
ncbi:MULTISPECIES: DUF6009 family protein [unclassified Streptomyces]|uniref:DUF6009 family protein n=1 Tax=unclassified Streptomyces TaxID=2593676 RepID=UPI00344E02E5